MRRIWRGLAAALAILLVASVVAVRFFVDEPLRRRMEASPGQPADEHAAGAAERRAQRLLQGVPARPRARTSRPGTRSSHGARSSVNSRASLSLSGG